MSTVINRFTDDEFTWRIKYFREKNNSHLVSMQIVLCIPSGFIQFSRENPGIKCKFKSINNFFSNRVIDYNTRHDREEVLESS